MGSTCLRWGPGDPWLRPFYARHSKLHLSHDPTACKAKDWLGKFGRMLSQKSRKQVKYNRHAYLLHVQYEDRVQ